MLLMSNIAIFELNSIKSILRANGIENFRIRYRGPRFNIPTDTRSNDLKRSTCLKVNAKRFSVYLR